MNKTVLSVFSLEFPLFPKVNSCVMHLICDWKILQLHDILFSEDCPILRYYFVQLTIGKLLSSAIASNPKFCSINLIALIEQLTVAIKIVCLTN
jgi:hypothetical protein